ncbi:MarR family winged helix-turn-helix transcriptional regulator [Propionispora vibrioides]|uniref:DNA-binding transcriptional regulator, MarR family n=1 Tax=Propionispora vibrioides TaxID=112903 RepID=A0A1H8VGI0_9FIRM|nr:MarR family transcriptional regulator [Propionispora vibrioides]SEP14511.1 DNA-binding transcriptional regulator, MarR family [Propionispora vibrioides]
MIEFDLLDIPARKTLQELSRKKPELDVLSLESMLKFLRTAYEMHNTIYGVLEKYGLSKGKFTALIIMYSEGQAGMNPSEIAEKAGVSRAAITGLLSRLERDGLIERQNDLHDGRMTTVRLSSKGVKLMDKVLPIHFLHSAEVMSELSEQNHIQLEILLQKMKEGIFLANEKDW